MSMLLMGAGPLSAEALVEAATGQREVEACSTAMGRMESNAAQAGDGAEALRGKISWLLGHRSLPHSSEALAVAFIEGHCAGVGPPLPDEVVRAAALARARVLLNGVSGARPVVVQKLLELARAPALPPVPSQGSVGAAGDLAPMAHLARGLCGRGAGALAQPLQPSPKEALSLINGVSLSAAIGAFAVVQARRIWQNAALAAAMSMEALGSNLHCLDAEGLRWRPHPGDLRAGERLRAWLEGSRLVVPREEPDDFSLRCAPAVLGALHSAITMAEEVVERELSGCSDNPLVLDQGGQSRWVELGHVHGASLALALDHLRAALTQMATQSERRSFRLTDGALNRGLPRYLIRPGGLRSGFMLAQYTAASLCSEMKGLSHPASVDSIPTVQAHEDHNSMAPIAARLTLECLDCAADVVAVELLLAAQALDFRRRGLRAEPVDGVEQLVAGLPIELAPALAQVHDQIRKKVRWWEEDGILMHSLDPLRGMVRAGVLVGPPRPWCSSC
jgi:histidine ammonia-lyase